MKQQSSRIIGPPSVTGEDSKELQASCCTLLIETLSAVGRKAVERWALAERMEDLQIAQDFLAAIFVIRDCPTELRNRVLEHPSFCYWLKGLRRVSRGDQEENERRLMEAGPGFAWPLELARGGVTRPWRTRTDDRGGLRLVPWNRYVEFGIEHANAPVTVEPDNGGAAFRFDGDETVHRAPGSWVSEDAGAMAETPGSVRLRQEPYLGKTKIVCSARDPFLRADLTGTNQRDTGVNFFGTRDELYLDEPDLSVYEKAMAALEAVWPEQAADLARFTKVFVPMQPGPDAYRAFTVSSRQGAVFLDQIPPEFLVENIIHENAHIKLRQLEMLGPLLEDPQQDQPRFSVPWRPDPRPIPGITEGIWVFSHVAEYRFRLWSRLKNEHLKERLDQQMKHLNAACTILAEHARFTPAGSEYFEALSSWVDDLNQRSDGRQ